MLAYSATAIHAACTHSRVSATSRPVRLSQATCCPTSVKSPLDRCYQLLPAVSSVPFNVKGFTMAGLHASAPSAQYQHTRPVVAAFATPLQYTQASSLGQQYGVSCEINDVDVHIVLDCGDVASIGPETPSAVPTTATLLKTVPVPSILLESHSPRLAQQLRATPSQATAGGTGRGSSKVPVATAAGGGKILQENRLSVFVVVTHCEHAVAVEHCLRFMFTGTVEKGAAAAARFAAKHLGMPACLAACAVALSQELKFEEQLKFAYETSNTDTEREVKEFWKEVCWPMLLEKCGSIAKFKAAPSDWEALPYGAVLDLLRSKDFATDHEDSVLNAVHHWLQQQPGCSTEARGLLRQVRVLQLSLTTDSFVRNKLLQLADTAEVSRGVLLDLLVYVMACGDERETLRPQLSMLPEAWMREDARPSR